MQEYLFLTRWAWCSFFGWCSVLIVYVGLWEYFICGFTGVRTESLQEYG